MRPCEVGAGAASLRTQSVTTRNGILHEDPRASRNAIMPYSG